MESLEVKIKQMIIEALNLEDITPADIDTDAPLFGEGLGLDSIDALELGVAIRQTFQIKIEAATDEVKQHFASVRNLARFIAGHMEKARP